MIGFQNAFGSTCDGSSQPKLVVKVRKEHILDQQEGRK